MCQTWKFHWKLLKKFRFMIVILQLYHKATWCSCTVCAIETHLSFPKRQLLYATMWHVASVCHLQSYLRHFAFEAATWTICQVVTYDLLRLASCSSYWFASPSLGITLFISETPEKDTCATLRNTNWEIQLHSTSIDWFASLCACIWLCNADSASFFFCRLPSPSVALPPLPIFPFLWQPLNLKFKDSCRIQIKHILCVT